MPKIGVRADYSLLQVAALVTEVVSWGQVQATVGAQKKVLAIIIKRRWGGWFDCDFQIQTYPPRTPLIENLFAEKRSFLAELGGTPLSSIVISVSSLFSKSTKLSG